MKKKKVYIALKEREEIESISSFFHLFQYDTIELLTLDNIGQEILPNDILIVDLYFNSTSVLQTEILPRENKYKVFLTTPRTLFEKEEGYAQDAKMNILKKPINYDVLYRVHPPSVLYYFHFIFCLRRT
jgi:hypothetical protein